MSETPHQVLSEHFQERMAGRRLVAAVFTAFQFDPGFFEQEILPVFFDTNLSHASVIKLVQLEDVLRSLPGSIAVYYDANGLIQSGDGAAKLDARRIPIRWPTGIFHPKNVFALVEQIEPDEHGQRGRTLLVAALSANLTRTGWWENVEVCHVEELVDRSETAMRDDLLGFFAALRKRAPDGSDHGALEQVAAFVKRTEQLAHRSAGGRYHSHFYSGGESFDDFVARVIGGIASERPYLEVISPYFDKDDESAPLAALLRRLRPRETRVFLPRNESGVALCPEAMYRWVAELPDVAWGKLPKSLLKSGTSEDAKLRFVHAKMYRLFWMHEKREILIVGSVNLTHSAHQIGGNLESALLVDYRPPRRPDFWLELDKAKPLAFGEPPTEDGDLAIADSETRLSIRFHWNDRRAEVYWDAKQPSAELVIEANGVNVFGVDTLPPQSWKVLTAPQAEALAAVLATTSFVTVRGDRPDPVPVLVQEEGMWKKPSLLSRLSVEDILHYWSLLTPEQRNEFIQLHEAELLGDTAGGLLTVIRREPEVDSIFARFAGTFHAFECLDKSVRNALENDNEKEALYRLFGMRHDALGSLLLRVREDTTRDPVDTYVLASCAKQLCRELRGRWPELWTNHANEAAELGRALEIVDEVRQRLIAKQPDTMGPFLDWFDRWFLERAKALPEEAS